MAEKKPTETPTERAATKSTTSKSFTADERAAMRERAKERKAASRAGAADGDAEVVEKLAAMAAPDRAMGERLHALVKRVAPGLVPRLWYGMPAYAKEGSVVCFFQDARKFKTRYATLGFSDKAALDEGDMWPSAFALHAWTDAVETRIAELLQRAAR